MLSPKQTTVGLFVAESAPGRLAGYIRALSNKAVNAENFRWQEAICICNRHFPFCDNSGSNGMASSTWHTVYKCWEYQFGYGLVLGFSLCNWKNVRNKPAGDCK